jgi:prepilin-type N-terminal cleavage/methylation domain-containing protein
VQLELKAVIKAMIRRKKSGFTLIEILIVVAILSLLTISSIFMLTNNLAKGRDTKRKGDLDRIKIAFEEYYVDNDTYPPEDALSNCGSSDLSPYLQTVPCDPKTKSAYCYVYDADNIGQNYRILGSLEYKNDPIISKLNCDDDPDYCGHEDVCSSYGSNFNYGVASSNIVVNAEVIGGGEITPSPSPTPTPTPSPSPTPTPLPSTTPGQYACSPTGVCNNYAPNPGAYGCPLTFSNSGTCTSYCPTSPIYARCTDVL